MILVNDRRVSWIKHIKEEVNWWMEDAVSPARAVYTSPISSPAVYMQQSDAGSAQMHPNGSITAI